MNDSFSIELDGQDPTAVVCGQAFTSLAANIKDVSLHYVRGGSGAAIIFLHGFSQDWFEFAELMCLLADQYTVIAVDLRGIGKSTDSSTSDYSAQSLASDIYDLVKQLDIAKTYIVGHDMGGMVAYAYARMYPAETRGIAILDAPLPGTPSTDLMVKLPFLWHFSFHRIPGLPEWLISGREYAYFKKAFFNRFTKNKQAITEAHVQHYASAYQSPAQLRAGLGLYRAYHQNSLFMKTHREELQVPILLLESDYGSKEPGPAAKELVEQFGCRSVKALVVEGCGHFMADEQPGVVANLIRDDIATKGL